jgi:exosome complex RNA-binding protein Rrp42 (RNase PH superfamily)
MFRHEPSLNEKDFVIQALRKGLRLDGRTPFDLRHIKLSFNGNGKADVQVGKTRYALEKRVNEDNNVTNWCVIQCSSICLC